MNIRVDYVSVCAPVAPTDKRQDLLVRGRKDEELQEKYGFLVENNMAEVELLAQVGQQVRESEYNALGYNRQGIYLCKHADVCLQHSLVKHSGSQVMRMIMCQVLLPLLLQCACTLVCVQVLEQTRI